MNIISIRGVSRHFGAFTALDKVDLDVREGEFFSLLGPSGCGKTTLLRMIGGFMEPSSGSVMIDEKPMDGLPPNRRPTNMVFQSYAIFPHLNVADNVGYGLRRLRLDPSEFRTRVDEALERVGLSGLGHRGGNELSGGQRQRVALARALIMKPKVLLLDEPLSALDKKLREQMQIELRRLQRAVGITFILVTHDQYEALSMSDRVAVMFKGRIAQVAPPQEIYQRPASRDVADFLGGMNFIEAQIEAEDAVELKLTNPLTGPIAIPRREGFPQGLRNATLGIRPERLRLLGADESASIQIAGTLSEKVYYGEVTHYTVAVGASGQTLQVAVTNSSGGPELAAGTAVKLGLDSSAIVLLAP
jgi:spermidine/putrescine transport system ATP-binding protein